MFRSSVIFYTNTFENLDQSVFYGFVDVSNETDYFSLAEPNKIEMWITLEGGPFR